MYTWDGDLLLEESFRNSSFVTYRAYKFNFVGKPIEPPTLKAFSYGTSASSSRTVYYVSWNGATEVATWKFYRTDDAGDEVFIGSAARTGFGTMFQSSG